VFTYQTYAGVGFSPISPSGLGCDLAAAFAALTVSRPEAARATTVQTAVTSHGGAKPTIVLVHGAWADNSSWNAVVGRFQGLG
jgi:hypothetical protein